MVCAPKGASIFRRRYPTYTSTIFSSPSLVRVPHVTQNFALRQGSVRVTQQEFEDPEFPGSQGQLFVATHDASPRRVEAQITGGE